MNELLVSIVMPVYNVEKYLQESINSILNQTYRNIELIIIDDGSTDSSVKIIKNYKDERIKAFYFENGGCSKQRNFGLTAASGYYLALMDADDISECDRIKNQVEFLQSNIDIDVLGTNASIIDNNGKIIREKKYPEFHKEIEFIAPILSPICHASMMTRKKVLLDVRGYSEQLSVAGDYDLLLRLLSNGYRFQNIQKCLYTIRIRNDSLSYINSELQKENHYKCGINFLENTINLTGKRFVYDYRRGLLEYYFGDIVDSRKYLIRSFFNNSAPKLRLLRLLVLTLFGNRVIKSLRKKGILESLNKLIYQILKFDLQKIKIKK